MGVFSKWLESLDYDFEILSSCTRYISPRSTCQKCVENCNQKAISIVNGKPSINQEECIQCGDCIPVCPVQAISGIYPKRSIFQKKLIMEGSPPNVKELLILHRKGINTIIGDSKVLLEKWHKPIEEANAILSQIGEEQFSVENGTIEKEIYVSRRELFSLWKKESKSLLKEITPASWRFNHSSLDLSKYYEDIQFVEIAVDTNKCTLCQVCQKLCPKKCFHIQDEKFIISPQGCENCQLCADTCPEKAITVIEGLSKLKETVFRAYEKTCQVCEETFITLREEEQKCLPCKKREMFQRKIKGA